MTFSETKFLRVAMILSYTNLMKSTLQALEREDKTFWTGLDQAFLTEIERKYTTIKSELERLAPADRLAA